MVYILGSLNMDITFEVERMPMRGETLASRRSFSMCGGKGGNQAVAAAKLGAQTAMIAHTGIDGYGRTLKNNLAEQGINVRCVTPADGMSGLAAIFLCESDNRIVLSGGANLMWSFTDIDAALIGAKAGDILLSQLEIPIEIVAYAFSIAHSKGMITILNPAPACDLPPQLYQNTDIITPNETETEILTGVNPIDIIHSALAVKKFYSHGVRAVIITLGSKGAVVSHGQNITEIDAVKVKAVDTTAAGDTFIGAFAAKLEAGVDVVEACRFANCAASITVQRYGASESIPTLAEAEAVYRAGKT